MLNQFQYCEKERVPLIVIVGEEERANGGVKIRNVENRQEVHCCASTQANGVCMYTHIRYGAWYCCMRHLVDC